MHLKIALAFLAAAVLHAQSAPPASDLKFEVASVKPSIVSAFSSIGPAPGGERYQARSVNLKTMIQTAYRVRADQIAGGPDWLNRDRFDIEAKAAHASSPQQLRAMLQNLLAERFHLQLRIEAKDAPVYLLTVDKSGSQLSPHAAERTGDARVEISNLKPLHVKVTGISASLDLFVFRMGYLLDRPLIDRTGLQGDYDFSLEFTLEPPSSMQEGMLGHDGKPIDFSGPTIFTALPRQMGLRLENGTAPVETLFVRSAEKPTEN